MAGVWTHYQSLIAAGVVSPDPAQADAAQRLDQLASQLAVQKKPGLFSAAIPVRGLYIWGGVGRGKSMLMDLFFASAGSRTKKRVHFHEFMAEVHDRLDAWRKMDDRQRRRSAWYVRSAGNDPIAPVAKQIAAEAGLLCFDEFQVTQIADAMILGRLFDQLFDRGITVVATSNRHPDDLYRNGINRQLFLPFIKRLKQACDILELAGIRDYRLDRLTAAPVWYAPLGAASREALDQAWQRLTCGAEPARMHLIVKGRRLEIPRAAAGVARFTFGQLCAAALGPLDYLALAENFHTILLEEIPYLSPDRRNEAARFVSLIDALYEARVKLVASAETSPDQLYPAGDGAFEFERTASRLFEMRSMDYLSQEKRQPGQN
jgi:cell division protein ZapE